MTTKMLSEIDVAKELLRIKAIKLQPDAPFTWASGMRSPIYCDNRKVLSHPDLRRGIIDAFAAMAQEYDCDIIAGVATAGIAHGALLAEKMNLPMIYVRSKAKAHGAKNQIEGDLTTGKKCLVIEDLISTGGSSIAAVDVLRDAGMEVLSVFAIFNYQLPAATSNFAAAQCPYDTLSNYAALMEAAKASNQFKVDQLASLQEWRKDPKLWSAQHGD